MLFYGGFGRLTDEKMDRNSYWHLLYLLIGRVRCLLIGGYRCTWICGYNVGYNVNSHLRVVVPGAAARDQGRVRGDHHRGSQPLQDVQAGHSQGQEIFNYDFDS
jgi:hypothetical protein